MQPFSHNQQLPFRYFDSDMAKKRPLVVSFRRIQKMTPHTLDSCESAVSICDIHRLDFKPRDSSEVATMKIISKYNSKPLRVGMQKKGFKDLKESQSCRTFLMRDKQKPQPTSLFDEHVYDLTNKASDKGCVFPKEKFYGNAKILLTMNNDILRKDVIDCDEESFERRVDRDFCAGWGISHRHNLTMGENRKKQQRHWKSRMEKNEVILDDNEMIDGWGKFYKTDKRSSYSLSRDWDHEHDLYKSLMTSHDTKSSNIVESETRARSLDKKRTIPKSFSTSTFYTLKKLSSGRNKMENGKAPLKAQKSVSMLSIHGKAQESKIVH